MRLLKNLLVICVIAFSSSAWALEFSEFGLVNLNLPLISDSTNPSLRGGGGFSLGGGLTLGFTVWKELVVESGVVYLVRNYSTSSDTQPQTSNRIDTFQVPLVLRYWLTPNFSVGLGGYFAHYSGDLFQSQGTNTSRTYWRGDLKEFGILPTIRLKSPISDLMSAILDARFLYALTNSDGSGITTHLSREFQLWAGISFIL